MDWRRQAGLIVALALIAGGVLLLSYEPGGVTVTWETASEVNTMGFNLYRAEGSAEAAFEQVNAELIAAEGDPLVGASYQVEDQDVGAGRLYFYQIEEVEWSGTRTRYPEVVQVRAGIARAWLLGEGAALILVGCGLTYLQVRPGRRPARE
jgi:hypothetical protein